MFSHGRLLKRTERRLLDDVLARAKVGTAYKVAIELHNTLKKQDTSVEKEQTLGSLQRCPPV
jgi:hypothetical protein